jgi:hypothetical protein
LSPGKPRPRAPIPRLALLALASGLLLACERKSPAPPAPPPPVAEAPQPAPPSEAEPAAPSEPPSAKEPSAQKPPAEPKAGPGSKTPKPPPTGKSPAEAKTTEPKVPEAKAPAEVKAPAGKPAPQAKPSPAEPDPTPAAGIPTPTTTGTTATKPAPAADGGTTAQGAPAKPPGPPPKSPAPQAKVAATALKVEAEQLARPDAGPAGPDYANAPRRPKGGGGSDPPPEPLAPTKAIPGGPLAIPGSKVDFEARRVERFLEEGGAVLAGRVLDADSGKGVDDAGIEAWMGTRSIHADTDPNGVFRFDGMVPGSRVTLWITATQKYVQERIEVAIPSDRPRLESTFKLLPRSAASGHSGGIGVFLSRRAGRTVISGLDAFGPAERAGLSIGDAIVGIGKRNVSELGPGAIEYLLRGTIGEDVSISVAGSNGKEAARAVTLKRAGR